MITNTTKQTLYGFVFTFIIIWVTFFNTGCWEPQEEKQGKGPEKTGCVYKGQSYAIGDNVEDDCNTCACSAGGEVVCTTLACAPTCEWNGETLQNGQQVEDEENCGYCICMNGQMACTDSLCPPTCEWNGETLQDGQKVEDEGGCGYCICMNGQMACTDSLCPPVKCEMDGISYELGAQVGLGCNTCVCTESGQFTCTQLGCPAACEFKGQPMQEGEVMLVKQNEGGNCEWVHCYNGNIGWPVGPCVCELDGQFYEFGDQVEEDDTTCTCQNTGGFECVESEPNSCKYKGQLLQEGQQVWVKENCSHAFCQNGKLVYGLKSCVASQCSSNGQSFELGESYTNDDGCTVCTCMPAGPSTVWMCSIGTCSCNPEEEYYRHYVAGAKECAMMDQPICPEGATYFSNECGCGCEMSSSCPEVANCMPPAQNDWCTTDALAACPYTSIEQ
ncbi:MAG TPA: hypothetical protein EYN66_16065 [Myxococcales bacterium]|nr:hypothetical protein [Myxococcales bacterium]